VHVINVFAFIAVPVNSIINHTIDVLSFHLIIRLVGAGDPQHRAGRVPDPKTIFIASRLIAYLLK
jgi:hypothetical protein